MRRAPHDGIRVQETLDIILTAAAFDRNVSLLFLDDGVYQLKMGQATEAAGLKDVAPIFKALLIYDVRTFYVERESLVERGLDADRLILPVKLVARQEVCGLLRRHDLVV